MLFDVAINNDPSKYFKVSNSSRYWGRKTIVHHSFVMNEQFRDSFNNRPTILRCHEIREYFITHGTGVSLQKQRNKFSTGREKARQTFPSSSFSPARKNIACKFPTEAPVYLVASPDVTAV